MSESWRTRRTLLVRAQDQNDELAWEEFTAYYQDFIVIILRKMGMNPNYLDDIVQETLIKIWKGLTRFDLKDEKSKFRAWLKTVIRNTAYTCYNKQKKHHIQNTTLENIEEPSSQSDEKIDQLIEKEWDHYVYNMAMKNIKGLFSERALVVFDLFLDGKSIEDISQQVGIKENSVYKLKNRVKARLKQEVDRISQELEPQG